jgi:ubiquinone/menaquinone biosynthesis C-methylase UbiE
LTPHDSKHRSRKTYFDKAAESWDQKYVTPELEAFLENLIPTFGLQPGHTVLDVGTGTGLLIPFLLQAIGPSGSITAIDYSENMIQRFRAKYASLKNVTVKLQDVEALDLPPEAFDAAICFGICPHLDRKVQALSNLHHVVKWGGKLVIAHALSRAEMVEHHNGKSPVAQDVLPDDTEMKQLLRQAGFSNIHIRDEPGLYLCLAIKTCL